MLYLKELKKVCFSIVYLLFLGILLFNWYENYYGITASQIEGAQGKQSFSDVVSQTSILTKPEKSDDHYGWKQKEVPEKIMCGATDKLIMEYLNNSYATYPFHYYKEVVLDENEQKEILAIIEEVTGLSENQIENLPDGYFPAVNGNIIHINEELTESSDGGYRIQSESQESHTSQFVSQVSYQRFKELMKKAEKIIGRGSYYSQDMLLTYYGQAEMTYEEAMAEYQQTISEDRVSIAFARLYCDYMTRIIGFYPVFLVVMLYLKDRRFRMNEIIYVKQTKPVKLITMRTLALLTAVMVPVILLSFESLFLLIKYSVETGVAIDVLAFVKYILWWLLPTALVVIGLATFVTVLTGTHLAIVGQFVWWFIDTSLTGLSGDTKVYTLMIRYNMLNGAQIIRQDWEIIWLNRGIMLLLAIVFMLLAVYFYQKKCKGYFNNDGRYQKWYGFFKKRFLAHFSL